MSRQFYPHFFSNRFFDDFRDRNFERHFTRPYWTDYTLKESNKFGDGVGNIIDDDEQFSITIDTSQFSPEDLKVNIVDGQLIIEGKHESKIDQYGEIERSFVRKLMLPKNVTAESVTSELTKDGMLTVQTPKKSTDASRVRTIPIFRKD
ncbi:unnamed protein product [Dracunculus medinensis]|uniref:SHSP domain-containing protein n=1 Tax=Dracunculus medinensis TaxID=318479 RepID=A0A0N4U4E6_DRAME|nr:unnamed protein product [Dracunculus medinensis]